MQHSSRKRVAAVAVAVVGIAMFDAMPAGAESYSGRAYGLLLGETVVCDSGFLPTGGGTLTDSVDNPSASAGLHTIGAASATCLAVGASAAGHAEAEVQDLVVDLNVGVLGTVLAATRCRTVADVACEGLEAAECVIDGLTIGGVAVDVTGEANQTVAIPGIATVVINEQVVAAGEVMVNALRITILGGIDCVVASASIGIADCPPPLPVEQSTWGKVKALYR